MDGPAAVAGPTVWRGGMLEEKDWLVPVDDGAPPAARGSEAVSRAVRCLRRGPGLAVVRGLDLDAFTDDECVEACRAFITPLGTPRRVDPARPGDGLVRESGSAPLADTHPNDLALHTDRAMFPGPPRWMALMCVRPAAHGGASVLSGHAVDDALLRSRPEAVRVLQGVFRFGDEPAFERAYPVFRRADSRLEVQYNRYWITRGQQEHGTPLSPAQVAALDAFDEILTDPRMALHVRLRRGDLLLLDNTAVLHGRTSFVEPPPPLAGRCLVRVWAD